MKICFILVFLLTLVLNPVFTQDKGVYKEYENTFYQNMLKTIEKFEQKETAPAKQFRMDFTDKKYPTDIAMYKQVWHTDCISQGNSGTCWAFASTSFFESEIYRLTGKKVDLSEIYTAYWETVEKARRFVQERGNSLFDEGSQGNAVGKIWLKYGIVPETFYSAKKANQQFHNHSVMFEEMKKYLQNVKASGAWNEKAVVETIQAIMNHHIGAPPKHILVDGKKITPKQYFQSLHLRLDDYVDLLSLSKDPYYQMVEYTVPDNWWHSKKYLNIPLEDFMSIMKNAVRQGFSVCLGGDVSEPGYDLYAKVAVVPSFDIPSQYIDENARMFRFSNATTTDDHGIHCVGWLEKDGKDWYLIKDSGSGSRNTNPIGYYFYHEDYIKLKMMNIMVHKDAAISVLQKYADSLKK